MYLILYLVDIIVLGNLWEVKLVGDAACGVREAPVWVVGAGQVGWGTSNLGEGRSCHGIGHHGVEGDEDDDLEDEHDDEGDVDTAGGSTDMISIKA